MSEQVLDYIYHETEDIHEFKPLTSTRDVIKPYIDVLDKIMPETIAQEKRCALILWNMEGAEIFPLRLQNAYFQKMVQKYPNIPPAFIAYTTDRISDITMIRAHYLNHKDTRQIFPLAERENAIQWLLECRQRLAGSN